VKILYEKRKQKMHCLADEALTRCRGRRKRRRRPGHHGIVPVMPLSLTALQLMLPFLLVVSSAHGWQRRWSEPAGFLTRRRRSPLFCCYSYRGGEANNDFTDLLISEAEEEEQTKDDLLLNEDAPRLPKPEGQNVSLEGSKWHSIPIEEEAERRAIKVRRTSDFIQDITTRSAVDNNPESLQFRRLMEGRTAEYLQELDECEDPPHPKKLLHYLAPKIPSIKHSPDAMLRIRSARSDMDSGVAACLIGTLGHACEVYEKVQAKASERRRRRRRTSVAEDIIKDRRFEQLIECVLCGVDVKKRKKEYPALVENHDRQASSDDVIEDILENEDVHFDEGLCIRDSCRAAWGIAILGLHEVGEVGGENVMDLLMALALRVRELLLAALLQLRQGDLFANVPKWATEIRNPSVEDLLTSFSEELAEDAATAMWTFACVTALTGMRCLPLFEACFSILCQHPFDMRRQSQEVEASVDAATVGSNDIVEQLRRSEEREQLLDSPETEVRPTDVQHKDGASAERKDALVDWLSPTEMTDVLWALAVHGTKTTTDLNEKEILSETLDAFRETAFDRILDWLYQDLKTVEQWKLLSGANEPEKELVPVEMVDASTILESRGEAHLRNVIPTEIESEIDLSADSIDQLDPAVGDEPGEVTSLGAVKNTTSDFSQREDSVDLESVAGMSSQSEQREVNSAENLSIDIMSNDEGTTEQVRAVDASAILSNEMREEYLSPKEVESEQFVSSSSGGDTDVRSEYSLDRTESLVQLFSPHDLCSVAWAVTELQDSLRGFVTGAVMDIFVDLGPESLKGLTGSDLTNLAWAVAKHTTGDDYAVREDSAVVIGGWIAEEILRAVREESKVSNPLYRFHPPEFSRLLWSMATIFAARVDGTRLAGANADEIGCLGIITAAKNLEVFGTEDLARIVWGFLALSNPERVLRESSGAFSLSLGKILATIETSLLQWESCKLSLKKDGADSVNVREATRFASFLGRSRLHVPFLDQRLDDLMEETSEPQVQEKSRLPLLRDLPIDPLTLCKLACWFERLADRRPGVKTSHTLTRIALRLLTSREGRLLVECPTHDLVRLCEAAARTDLSVGRELISLFTRRVVRLLNSGHYRSEYHDVTSLGPGDTVTLLWSLGELGVKYHPKDREKASAHRRLNLVTSLPTLNKDELIMLSNPSAKNLVRGTVEILCVKGKRSFPLTAFIRFRCEGLFP
jgi:hypothetical protein